MHLHLGMPSGSLPNFEQRLDMKPIPEPEHRTRHNMLLSSEGPLIEHLTKGTWIIRLRRHKRIEMQKKKPILNTSNNNCRWERRLGLEK